MPDALAVPQLPHDQYSLSKAVGEMHDSVILIKRTAFPCRLAIGNLLRIEAVVRPLRALAVNRSMSVITVLVTQHQVHAQHLQRTLLLLTRIRTRTVVLGTAGSGVTLW